MTNRGADGLGSRPAQYQGLGVNLAEEAPGGLKGPRGDAALARGICFS